MPTPYRHPERWSLDEARDFRPCLPESVAGDEGHDLGAER